MGTLFGFMDYKRKQPISLLSSLYELLAKECEERGTSASGVAYLDKERLQIFKKPIRASKLDFKIPQNVHTVMGHTRLTTQGSEKKNYNNHPFQGRSGKHDFALAHNGMIWNDKSLRKENGLSNTKIETDSYVIAQLLEENDGITSENISKVMDLLEGSFTVSILDSAEILYLIKGCNPLSIVNFRDEGLLVYASTESILWRALIDTSLFPRLL